VLGVSAVAENAGEIMLAAKYAITMRMTVEQVADTWAPYLTMSEALRLVALSFRRDPPSFRAAPLDGNRPASPPARPSCPTERFHEPLSWKARPNSAGVRSERW